MICSYALIVIFYVYAQHSILSELHSFALCTVLHPAILADSRALRQSQKAITRRSGRTLLVDTVDTVISVASSVFLTSLVVRRFVLMPLTSGQVTTNREVGIVMRVCPQWFPLQV